MTEQAWLSSTEPGHLLRHINPLTTDRKLHLYDLACCRRIVRLLPHPDCLRVLDIRERFVEGDRSAFDSEESLSGMLEELGYQIEGVPGCEFPQVEEWVRKVEAIPKSIRDDLQNNPRNPCEDARRLLVSAVSFVDSVDNSIPWLRRAHHPIGRIRDRNFQSLPILRDVFGNPFHLVAFDPGWQTSTAVGLAQAMYESRDFGAMPILADALQDAGCEDESILTHCRDANQAHVRGCWVVDAILGRS